MEGPITRNEITGIADAGLVLQINGREDVAPWSAILAVSAVLALENRTSDRRIPVLVFGIMDGADERTFLVGQIEPLWEPLVSTLGDFLPGIPPLEVWEGELMATGKASLYDRAGGLQ